MTVMRGCGLPDRVPVSIGISEGYPVRFTTDDYLEFFHYNPIPIWKARADTESKLGGDNFIHLNLGVGSEASLEEIELAEEYADYIIYAKTLHTPDGELFAKTRLGRREGFSVTEPYVKDFEADFTRMLYLLPDPAKLDLVEYLEAYAYIGDSGCLAPCLAAPVDWLAGALGGPEKMIMAHFDHPELFREFIDVYTDWSLAFLRALVDADIPMDVIQIGAACHSYAVTSPAFFELYGVPFLTRVLTLEKEFSDKLFLQQHTCGKSRGVLEKCHALGMRAFEPIESPPMGDVDLAAAKRLFGGAMCLKGNLDSVALMYRGTPQMICEETKRKLEIGMPGGRYYCAVGDQIPYQTPPQNVEALVSTVLEYGAY